MAKSHLKTIKLTYHHCQKECISSPSTVLQRNSWKNNNPVFVEYAKNVADALLASDIKDNDLNELYKVSCGNNTVEQLHNDVLAKFSEKIESIFDDYRIIVDKYLAENLPTGIRNLSSIYSRL